VRRTLPEIGEKSSVTVSDWLPHHYDEDMFTPSRKWLKALAPRHVSRRISHAASKRRRFCRLGFEVLEDRVVLAVGYSLDTNEVKFTGDKSDDLYVQVAGGVLQWGATGSSLSPVNDGNGPPFQVTADEVIKLQVGRFTA
jgi:hypothetical protein